MEAWILSACFWFGFAAAIVAGVFLSFSDFVMAGLVRSEPAGGIESMQQLNRTVFRSIFLTTFLLLVPLTVGFAVYVALESAGAGRGYVVAAAVTYCLLVFGVTVVGNVPMNNKLDAMQPDSNEAAVYWKVYASVWTRWNHVRTLGAAATAVLFFCAAMAFGAPAMTARNSVSSDVNRDVPAVSIENPRLMRCSSGKRTALTVAVENGK